MKTVRGPAAHIALASIVSVPVSVPLPARFVFSSLCFLVAGDLLHVTALLSSRARRSLAFTASYELAAISISLSCHSRRSLASTATYELAAITDSLSSHFQRSLASAASYELATIILAKNLTETVVRHPE